MVKVGRRPWFNFFGVEPNFRWPQLKKWLSGQNRNRVENRAGFRSILVVTAPSVGARIKGQHPRYKWDNNPPGFPWSAALFLDLLPLENCGFCHSMRGGGKAEKFPPIFYFFIFIFPFLFCEPLKRLLGLVITSDHLLPPSSDVKKWEKTFEKFTQVALSRFPSKFKKHA